jgi:hypothetical protein
MLVVTETDGRIQTRSAAPADLPQLEAWCHAARPDDTPPYIAVTLAEFTDSPKRGDLLIIQDGDRDLGFVVLARLWSNRGRGDAVVLDDIVIPGGFDRDLLMHELRRHVAALGIGQMMIRDADGALTCPSTPATTH